MSHRGLLRACLLTTSLCAVSAPAFAQMVSPSPARQAVDENGVDLFHGTFSTTGPMISIGGEELKGMQFYRTYNGGAWRNNLAASILFIGNEVRITIDGVSDRLTGTDSYYSSTEGNGSSLTYNPSGYIYARGDGAVFIIQKSGYGPYPYGSHIGHVTKATFPDGTKYTYSYESRIYCAAVSGGYPLSCQMENSLYRLKTVTSNRGYRATLNYKDDGYVYDPSAPHKDPDPPAYMAPIGATLSNLAAPGSPTVSGTGFGDAMGRQTAYGYGAAFTITLPGSSSPDVSVVSSPAGKVSSVTKAGVMTRYSFADNGDERTTTVTDALDRPTTYRFSIASNRMKSVTDALGNVKLMEYDQFGRLKWVKNPDGDIAEYKHDDQGNVTEVRRKPGIAGTPAEIVTKAKYPVGCVAASCGKPDWTQDALGNQTDYKYDPTTGNILKILAPALVPNGPRSETTFSYTPYQAYYAQDPGGPIVASGESIPLLTSITQCRTTACTPGSTDETRTLIGYGPQANGTGNNLLPTSTTVQSIDGVLSATTTASYNAVGDVTAIDGPLPGGGDTKTFGYDANRLITSSISPDPDGSGGPRPSTAQVFTYNAAGQRTHVETGTMSPNFVAREIVRTDYDERRRPAATLLIAGGGVQALTRYKYDTLGRVQCVAQRMDPGQWSGQTDACVAQTTGPQGPDRITHTSYDKVGKVETTTQGFNTSSAATEQVTYMKNGLVQTAKDANGNLTSYTYDGYDRLARTTYPDGGFEQLGYDLNGNVKTRLLRDGQEIRYGYDAWNRLTRKDVPNGVAHEYDVSYAYDDLGRLTRATDDNGHFSGFGFDALGRKVREESNWTTRGFGYDLAGRMTRLTWGDGFFVTYEYDTTGAMTVVRENGGFALASFGYDELGRRTSLSRGNGATTTYKHDPALKLESLTHDLAGGARDLTLGFGYNRASQIAGRTSSNDAYAFTGHYDVTRDYGVNGLNQYTRSGPTTLGYDGRGNLTRSGTTGYGYTSENRLATSGAYVRTYDPLGRFHWIAEGGAPATWMQYDGDRLIEERDGNGVRRRYVHGPGADEPLVWYEGPGTGDKRWLHADERGSVVAVTDGSGQAIAVNRYDEHGIPGAGNMGRFQYTGQKWVPELGMYDYKARMYSPTLGRFMQTDPIGYADGMNWYNYVGGDPVNKADSTGLCSYINHYRHIYKGFTDGHWERVGSDYLGSTTYGCDPRNYAYSDFNQSNNYGRVGKESPTSAPQSDEGEDIVVTAAKKVAQCAVDQFGLGELGEAAAVAAGQPIPGTKRFVTPGSSRGTSLAGMAADKVFGRTRLPVRLPTIVGGPGTGRALAIAGTKSAARFAGRAVPIVGWALLAYDAASIAVCAASDD